MTLKTDLTAAYEASRILGEVKESIFMEIASDPRGMSSHAESLVAKAEEYVDTELIPALRKEIYSNEEKGDE